MKKCDGNTIKECKSLHHALKVQDFQGAFTVWQEHWERCIAAQGEFEGEGGEI